MISRVTIFSKNYKATGLDIACSEQVFTIEQFSDNKKGVFLLRRIVLQKNLHNLGDGTRTVKPALDWRADLKLVVDGITYLTDLSINVPFNLKQVVKQSKGEVATPYSIAAAVKRSMTDAEDRKSSNIAKHLSDKAIYDSLAFVPVVFSLGGGMGPQGTRILKRLNGSSPLPWTTKMFLRLMAKTIIRKTCEHCWWLTLAFAAEENNEYDPMPTMIMTTLTLMPRVTPSGRPILLVSLMIRKVMTSWVNLAWSLFSMPNPLLLP